MFSVFFSFLWPVLVHRGGSLLLLPVDENMGLSPLTYISYIYINTILPCHTILLLGAKNLRFASEIRNWAKCILCQEYSHTLCAHCLHLMGDSDIFFFYWPDWYCVEFQESYSKDTIVLCFAISPYYLLWKM